MQVRGRGLVVVEDVAVGDAVLSRDGVFHQVKANRGKRYRGNVTEVHYTHFFQPLACAPTHKLLVVPNVGAPPRWREAHMLVPGDLVLLPRTRGGPRLDYLDVPARHRPSANIPNGIVLPDRVPLDDDTLFMMGWYVAEGCGAGKHTLSLSGHRRERPMLRRCASVFERWGLRTRITPPVGNGIQLRTCSVQLVRWFTEMFGHLARNKHFPELLMSLSDKQTRVMLDAYLLGDGHRREEQQMWASVSPLLTTQVSQLVARLGASAGIRPCDATAKHGHLRAWHGAYAVGTSETSRANRFITTDFVLNRVSEVRTFRPKYQHAPPYLPPRAHDIQVAGAKSIVVGQATVST